MRKLLLLLLALGIAGVATAFGINTRRFVPIVHDVASVEPVAIESAAIDRFAAALRIPTISHADPTAFVAAPFDALHRHLQRSFPRVHAALGRERVGGHSVLYTWSGRDETKPGILLMGHLDVVPVEPGTERDWTHPPFAGVVADGMIWGRGAIDNKASVLGILEAVEMLLAEEFAPERTVYLAFGHDEELGGGQGAAAIAALLEQRGVRLEYVLDEGGAIVTGVLPTARPVALIGIAEKGYATFELEVRTDGGHSSMPPRETAIGILANALARIERRPMPARLDGAAGALFETLGPELPWAQRAVFANLWATRPLVKWQLARDPMTSALVRTTLALTIVEAGTKDNVLPGRARAIVNARIAPGDSAPDVLRHLRRVVRDPRVAIRPHGSALREASPVSPADDEIFNRLERVVLATQPDVRVAPWLVTGATDATHYTRLSENVYRFLPVRLGPADLAHIHGTNERIAVEDYESTIRFFRQLLIETASR
jgi:carboxypeptidase PM20D1